MTFADGTTVVAKVGATIPVSCCLLDDVVCEHPAYPPPPLRVRVKLRIILTVWWHRPRLHFGPCNHDDCC